MNYTSVSVEVLRRVMPPLRWEPIPRKWVDDFFTRKSLEQGGPSREDLEVGATSTLFEAQRILGRCLPPSDPPAHETGLVVGYVQSGKTLSFTTVISLARDNGYGLVIVLAGTKLNLIEQSEKRLRKDLGIDQGESCWQHFSNPRANRAADIQKCLAAWSKSPDKRKAALITVLKQKDNLRHLVDALGTITLSRVPAIIIDDEGDQASLNTKANKNLLQGSTEFSTIYEKIAVLRSAVPHHSFLQYTATPQANLLLAQSDLLNPSFAELVTPGDSYTGGAQFFGPGRPLIVDIPSREVPTAQQPVRSVPKTLIQALRFFLLSAAHHTLTRVRGKDHNRSMMVHPAQQTASHKTYKQWTDRARETLQEFIAANWPANPVVVTRTFQPEFESLAKSFPDIRPLNDLIDALEDVFYELRVVEVNSTQDAERNIDWKATRYWVLVGGQKLDRGYTVEGLCTTYMPRGLSNSPAADTLQQRARFFGYKKAYLGLCRVFLQGDVRDAFTEYVEHEESVRKALEECRGKPLREWRRVFLLSEGLKPTRRNVIGRSVRQIGVRGWIEPKALHREEGAVAVNREVLKSAIEEWLKHYGPAVSTETIAEFRSAKGGSKHQLIEGVKLRSIVEDFLLKLEIKDPSDAELHSATLVVLAAILDLDAEAAVDVFLMNGLEEQYRTREWNHPGKPPRHAPINNYFSASANTVNDKSLHTETRITLQLRNFKLGTTPRDETSADVFNVPWFVLHIPEKLRKGALVEA